ncbi:hypothetical protein RDV64_06160 [Acuticoccus sp. MNP-M23]|uniref:EF-hand domain-containing protein n=1 Tax=Acuticoccus sp. MNP-M23 TaxID=3072793 RepID=UPI002814FA93|nr:hypothetical protein [Acuticoccus sp. MNP-M23]WMS43975.1 hypothetical protein RDV64_06160 [Acuticoccus sp. MNP-M23]
MNFPSKVVIVTAGLTVAGAALAGAAQLTPAAMMPGGAENGVSLVHMDGGDRDHGKRHGKRGERGERHGKRHGMRHGRRGPGGRHGARGPFGPVMAVVDMPALMKAADTDGDRSLTQDEIDAFINVKVELGDANGDGSVTLGEFETIWLDLTRQAMVRSFQHLDKDGDATITAVEIDDQFGTVVEKMDRNGDGKIGRDDRGRRFGKGGPRGPQQPAPQDDSTNG